MRIQQLILQNFKIFTNERFELRGKSTIIFGINGTGKSTVLSAINFLNRVWINRLNPAQGKAFQSFTDDMIAIGGTQLILQCEMEIGGLSYPLLRSHIKAKRNQRKSLLSYHSGFYSKFTQQFEKVFVVDEMANMPIFVHYGTNRSVLDIPDRIRKKHDFDKLSALERAIENELDFRTFFEWYRDQEANEVIEAREQGDLTYSDTLLMCVRSAIEAMIGNVTGLRVKRNPVRMVVDKSGKEIRVDLLSDGEKCTLAMFGDLARRLALANPGLENPLEGEGIVLIDEIELHMHPSWQRKVLGVLRRTFPNIQFIVTSHSPFILNSLENVVIYDLENHLLVENGLDNIPYDGIVEGYFRADKLSNSLKTKFDRYKSLIKKESLSDDEINEVAELEWYLDEIPDYLSISISTEYQRLKLEFMNREELDG